ncbi:MAG: class I SAM-dependent methyltransferase, partial [Promethearchaeota archaeon]
MPLDPKHVKFFQETRECYENIYKDFNRSRGKKPWRPFEFFLESLIKKGKLYLDQENLVIDLGCGNGRHCGITLDRLNVKYYIGIDVCFSLLKIAKKNAGNNINVDFIQASMTNIPIRKKTIDIIISTATLHHVPN